VCDWILDLAFDISVKTGMDKIHPTAWRITCRKCMEKSTRNNKLFVKVENEMKRSINYLSGIFIALIFVLSGCGFMQTAYTPWEAVGTNMLGYKDGKIHDRDGLDSIFWAYFESTMVTGSYTTGFYTLYRCAELTLEKRYNYFMIHSFYRSEINGFQTLMIFQAFNDTNNENKGKLINASEFLKNNKKYIGETKDKLDWFKYLNSKGYNVCDNSFKKLGIFVGLAKDPNLNKVIYNTNCRLKSKVIKVYEGKHEPDEISLIVANISELEAIKSKISVCQGDLKIETINGKKVKCSLAYEILKGNNTLEISYDKSYESSILNTETFYSITSDNTIKGSFEGNKVYFLTCDNKLICENKFSPRLIVLPLTVAEYRQYLKNVKFK